MSYSPQVLVRCLLASLLAAACAQRGTAPVPGDNLTALASGMSAPELHLAPGEPIDRVLQSRVSGVDVATMPDGSLSVRIHGISSFISSSEPLYVIDGVPIAPAPGGSLRGLSPYDVESIQVLKDPASLTMYGSRGANGVIVVKTKKPGSGPR